MLNVKQLKNLRISFTGKPLIPTSEKIKTRMHQEITQYYNTVNESIMFKPIKSHTTMQKFELS